MIEFLTNSTFLTISISWVLLLLVICVFLLASGLTIRWKIAKVNMKVISSGNKNPSFRRKHFFKKNKDYILVDKYQINNLLEAPIEFTAKDAANLLLTVDAKRKKHKPKIDPYRREEKVYEDSHISIYKILPNEFIFYSKDFEEAYCFDIGARFGVINTSEGSYDNIEDIVINLNGNYLMDFDGRNL